MTEKGISWRVNTLKTTFLSSRLIDWKCSVKTVVYTVPLLTIGAGVEAWLLPRQLISLHI